MNNFFCVLAGAALGILSGMGIGGGTLLILYLRQFQGFSQTDAAGANLLFFLATAPFALISHIKNRLIFVKGGVISIVFGLIFAVLVSILTAEMEENILSKIFGVLCIAIGGYGLIKKAPPQGGEPPKD